jgi:hypothetical protein
VWQGAVRPLVVAEDGEGVQEGLELGDRGGVGALGAEPVLEGLLEPLDLALGLRVVWLAVLLGDPQAAQAWYESPLTGLRSRLCGASLGLLAGRRGATE